MDTQSALSARTAGCDRYDVCAVRRVCSCVESLSSVVGTVARTPASGLWRDCRPSTRPCRAAVSVVTRPGAQGKGGPLTGGFHNYPLLARTLHSDFGNRIVNSAHELGKRGHRARKARRRHRRSRRARAKSAHPRVPSTRRPARTSMSQKKSSASASAKASQHSMSNGLGGLTKTIRGSPSST